MGPRRRRATVSIMSRGIMSKSMFLFIAIAIVIESSGATPELPNTETILFESAQPSEEHEELPGQLVPESSLATTDPSIKKIERKAIRKALFMNVGKKKNPAAKVKKTKKKLSPKEKDAPNEIHKVSNGVDSMVRDIKAKTKETAKKKKKKLKKEAKKAKAMKQKAKAKKAK